MLSVAVMALLMMTTLVAVGAGQVVAARHTAAAAADLGALAGAADGLGPGSCVAAVDVVRANGAEPVSCQLIGADVVVTAVTPTEPVLGVSWRLESTARAGPSRG